MRRSSVVYIFEKMWTATGSLIPYVGKVQYVNDGEEIPHQNSFYQVTHKKKRFEFEKEIRLIYFCPQTFEYKKRPNEDYRINLNLKDLISEIWLSPYNDDNHNKEIESLIKKAGLSPALKRSTVLKKPT